MKVGKKIKEFCRRLIHAAVEENWEPEELAKLIGLITKSSGLKPKKIIKLVLRSGISNLSFISCMEDEGFSFSPEEKVSAVRSISKTYVDFIATIETCLNSEVFDISDQDTITQIIRCSEKYPSSFQQRRQLFGLLCSFSNKKRLCGAILQTIINSCVEYPFTAEEATGLIVDVISLDFFSDLRGKMKSFLKEFDPEIQKYAKEMIEKSFKLNEAGDIIESDEDEQGNLIDFVTYDESEGSHDSREEEEEEDDDDDDDEEEEFIDSEGDSGSENDSENGSENDSASESEEDDFSDSESASENDDKDRTISKNNMPATKVRNSKQKKLKSTNASKNSKKKPTSSSKRSSTVMEDSPKPSSFKRTRLIIEDED